MRYGMIIDLNRCYGCHACAVACKQKNSTPPSVFWTRIKTKEVGRYPDAHREFTPTLCMHCAEPACEKVCQYGATYVRPDGIVAIDQNKCVGCLFCIAACPYEARYFDYDKPERYFPGMESTDYERIHSLSLRSGAVSKCTLCSDRDLAGGDVPACVQTCPTQARIFGDLDSASMQQVIAGRGGYREKPEQGTEPSVYYLPRR